MPRAASPAAILAGLGAATCATLGAAALANHLAARRAERRYPPRGRFIEADGVRLHYLDEGTGPAVVLLHGNGAMAEDFRASGLIDRLSAAHRVIAFDRPGAGYSARPRGRIWSARAQGAAVGAALRRLGVERPVLVGHSWGTLVALAMALDRPEEVSALVLLSGYHAPQFRWDALAVAPLGLPLLGDLICHTVLPPLARANAWRFLQQVFAPSPVTGEFRTRFPLALSLRPGQMRASGADTALMNLAAASLRGRGRALTMPVILVAGAADRIVDTALHSRWLHGEVPGSELRELPGQGHMLHYTATEAVLAAIRDAVRAGA